MAKINRPNNIVTLGQTAPVGIGQGSIDNSLPVVIADNQPAVPVVEQNKVQSEVALSLLGIPRSEVALGIFADVNTYDVDPGEWSQKPVERQEFDATTSPHEFQGLSAGVKMGHGLSHVPEEAGALLEAPRNKSAVLTSKRFFRYQPGRVSAATFGVKSSITPGDFDNDIRNPAIRKYGIYDNFDGYYWETRDTGKGDQFGVVRRTQALIKYRSNFGVATGDQTEDYSIVGSDDASTSLITANTQSSASLTVTITDLSNPPKAGMSIYDTKDNYNASGQGFIPANTRIETVTQTDGSPDGSEFTITLSNSINGTTGTNTQFYCDFSGDLVIVRDKLMMTHAAIYDPTLLKDEETYTFTAVTDGTTGHVTLSQADYDKLEEGQMVMYQSDETNGDGYFETSILIIKQKFDASNTLTLIDVNGDSLNLTSGTLTASKHSLKTPVPFIFPSAIQKGEGGSTADIMWPYARGFGFKTDSVEKRVNFGPTRGDAVGAVHTDTQFGFNSELDIKGDIDDVNNGKSCVTLGTLPTAFTAENSYLRHAWSQWIRHNVKSKFYGVYEYRIPRSRFSFDFVDGSQGNRLRYSDNTRIAGGNDGNEKLPGDEVAGIENEINSIYEIDFEKVMMNKIEFSWYGAVGALFLVYVPVGNGEARWVRVHHLRASNQLKVASLGNATLPLTYTIYGGGTGKTLGRNDLETAESYAGGKTASEFVIKYGSSYYIDGGDRGTVKLFNYSNDNLVDLKSHVYEASSFTKSADEVTINYNDINLKGETYSLGNVDDILINSKVITEDPADSNLRVIFVERLSGGTQIKLYLNNAINANSGGLEFVTETGQSVYGLTSKTNITSSQGFNVRNRVQVYPTKLAAALTSVNSQADAVKLEMNKNVIFQENAVHDVVNATESLTPYVGTPLEVTGLATRLTSSNSSGDFNSLSIGEKLYGWFYVENTDGGNDRALFGYVYKISNGVFEFFPLESYTERLQFNDKAFLYARQYEADGSVRTTDSNDEQNSEEIERLSSIKVVEKQQRPIVGTGTKVGSFFLEKGSDYYDLSPYFDYNKDYISFPLTDIPDNLFFTLKTDDTSWTGKVGVALTWEEQ